jgi:hypothetical protein
MISALSTFSKKDLHLSDDSQREKYRYRPSHTDGVVHWVERKLLLGQVEFFTLHWSARRNPNPTCVYAGAAPGLHFPLLSKMFPTFTFHLYDSLPFKIEETDRIKIFQRPFSTEIAQSYNGKDGVFFLSDIRTADSKNLTRKALEKRGITKFDKQGNPLGDFKLIKEAKREADAEREKLVWDDMLLQQQWLLLIDPEQALIKFRLPFALDGKDRIVSYLKGVVYWQAWTSHDSAENRLKPVRGSDGKYQVADWSITEYEDWCFYRNATLRDKTKFYNIFDGSNSAIDAPELLNDLDGTVEAYILKLYFERLGLPTNQIYSRVKAMSKLITKELASRAGNEVTLAKLRSGYVAPDPFKAKATDKTEVPAIAEDDLLKGVDLSLLTVGGATAAAPLPLPVIVPPAPLPLPVIVPPPAPLPLPVIVPPPAPLPLPVIVPPPPPPASTVPELSDDQLLAGLDLGLLTISDNKQPTLAPPAPAPLPVIVAPPAPSPSRAPPAPLPAIVAPPAPLPLPAIVAPPAPSPSRAPLPPIALPLPTIAPPAPLSKFAPPAPASNRLPPLPPAPPAPSRTYAPPAPGK